jgi:hypothetical protein
LLGKQIPLKKCWPWQPTVLYPSAFKRADHSSFGLFLLLMAGILIDFFTYTLFMVSMLTGKSSPYPSGENSRWACVACFGCGRRIYWKAYMAIKGQADILSKITQGK